MHEVTGDVIVFSGVEIIYRIKEEQIGNFESPKRIKNIKNKYMSHINVNMSQVGRRNK